MNKNEILKQLEMLGDEKIKVQNRKWGADDKQFGNKLGDVRKIAAKIKINHDLALELWNSGYLEAMQLALLIIDVKKLTADDIDKMVKFNKYPRVADWFYSYIIKDFPGKDKLREKWMKSKDKMCLRMGWSLTSGKVARDSADLDISGLLDRIEKQMGKASPEEQWTMNSTLAQIGISHPKFRNRAIEIGEKLGVYRDYPVSKGCTSPFAPIWINEMVKRQG